MALEIRPIPVITGEDAERLVARAEASEKNPHTVQLSLTREDVRKMMGNPPLERKAMLR